MHGIPKLPILTPMQKKEFTFAYTTHTSMATLPASDQQLLAEAMNACDKAYAPYSQFKVGAAIRTKEHVIITGSNQENGAFPIGQCAERVALYNMIHSLGRKSIDTIAIAVDSPHLSSPASPCGSCRQVLSEYRSYQDISLRLLLGLVHGSEIIEVPDINDLLPFAFNGKFLGT